MGGMYRMQDLLKIVAGEGADELRLEPGRPPVMLSRGKVRVVDGGLVTNEDVEELFGSIATEEQTRELAQCGDIHFILVTEQLTRFKVSAAIDADHLNVTAINLSR